MSKAARSPTPRRKREYLITDHVVDQMRKRYTLDGIGHRDETDLKNLIDQAVSDSVRHNDYLDILDEGSPARIVRLQQSLNDALCALVKKNTDKKHPEFEEAVLTLLKNDQVERSMESGKFKPNDGAFGLDDKSKDALRSVVPSKGHTTTETTTLPMVTVQTWFVHYSTKAEGAQFPEEHNDSKIALKRMEELSNKQKTVPGSVRLSKVINTQRRFTLQED